ncbi:glycosyltransferase, partial [Peribacillus simplex]
PNTIDINKHYKIQNTEIINLKEKLNLNGKVVGFVGNLIDVKRSDRLPEIFNSVKKEYGKEVSFLVIGQGENAILINRKCKMYGINCVHLGKVEPSDVNKFINVMDVLILPSREEAFGLVILEANACGTLAIGSNIGGIPDVIGNPEFLVEENENFENEFGKKVSFYLENGYESKKLIERVEKYYSPQELHRQEYKILDETLV